jgi:hypothetical protein
MNLSDLLSRSRASAAFRDAVADFSRSHRANDGVHFNHGSPPVKVERTLIQLLNSSPEMEIDRVEIHGTSGCEYFRGKMIVHTQDGQHTIQFHWDCKWKAQQEGWTDYFGFPDQIRAARERGFDCFRGWSVGELEKTGVLA